ncbi:type II toxin-antitoxin system HicA family toxin [Paenibacillus melissococcoides]|uniref:type II toxin-antitoxin system HicA family toxin n=1 Tax=Paenibacillus melissococcoides TaxID=2912268 RepID=UPI00290571FE|nr:type II toxin-antitoxin system HicA family toxin [Paenibacillus melissococcoides]
MIKAYSSREIIKILKSDGWVHKNTEGDHWHFVHPTKKGKVSVPHPKKDLNGERQKASSSRRG